MRSSATDTWPAAERVGSAFRMLMEIRMLIAAVSLLLLPPGDLSPAVVTPFGLMIVSSWLAARHWRRIAPFVAAHPLAYTLDMCISFTVLGIGGISGPYFPSTVVTAAIAGLLYRRRGMLAVSGLQILVYYTTYALTLPPQEQVTFQALLGQPLYYPLAGFAGVALRALLDDYGAKETALRRAEVQAAAAEERARLAREMHDSLAKTLRGIGLMATALPAWVSRDPERAVAEAHRIAASSETASREARTLLSELRDDSVVRSLPEAVRNAVDRWSAATSITVHCEMDVRAELPLRTRHEVVAILNEILTNIERHAEATTAHVSLTEDRSGGGTGEGGEGREGEGDREGRDEVVLTVRDDGTGFRMRPLSDLAREGHYGLVGLHERARRANGALTILSQPGAGTSVSVRLPADVTDERHLAEVS